MCGIVGYTGRKEAARILLEGLGKLEYRGYDSAGLAVLDGKAEVHIVKAKGRLRGLVEKTDDGRTLRGECGIGHTRWATHGEPSENNAHPHCSDDMNVVAVHNGIIENYRELRDKLMGKGYSFYSETDTEVITKLIDYYYKKYNIGPVDAIAKTMVRVRGSYAIAVMFHEYPGEIYIARKDSPLIVGVNDDGTYLASDVPAVLGYTRDVYYVSNLEMGRLRKDGVTFFDLNGDEVKKELTHISWSESQAEKGGYEHFMIKEIHEEPKAVRDTLGAYIKDGKVDFSSSGIPDSILEGISAIRFVACGSSYHVGLAGEYIMEDLCRIPSRVEMASEFRYRNPVLDEKELVIVISQSGETADTLAALRLARESGRKTLAVVNVIGSTISREADHVIYTLAGPEIAVATTKAYATQLCVIYLLAVKLAFLRGRIESEKELTDELLSLPLKAEDLLKEKEKIQWFASRSVNRKDVFFIGRGLDYALAAEGSLKLKEVSYIHSEAYASGELKHGTISLVEDGTLVIGLLTQPQLYEKTMSNMVECRTRGAYLMALTLRGNYQTEENTDFTVYIPKTSRYFTTLLAIIPLQLLSYYISVQKGLDVDKPRNLAKSVTVE